MDSLLNPIGHKVTLHTTDNLLLSGFIQYVDEKSNKLVLRDVKDVVSGKSVQGLQHFFRRDILELEVHEERKQHLVQQAKVNVSARPDAKHQRSIIGAKVQPEHLKHLKSLNPVELLLHASDQEEKQQCLKSGEEKIGNTHYILPENCTLVDDCSSQQFKRIVEYFCQQAVIAVAFEGVSLGRSGKLCWLLVASREKTVFFDILTMGKQAMDRGIGYLLELSSVLKVIHDCRLPSDLLYHQYDIKLHNVFDTQVASTFVYRLRKGGDFPRYVESLGQCLLAYLKLKKGDVHFMLVREHCQEEDEKVWMVRPVPANVGDAAYKHVCHLLNLRLVLMEEMMMEFITGVDIYLANVRDASESDARILQQARHRLPVEFANLSNLVEFDAQQNYSRGMTDWRHSKTFGAKDANGFQENCRGIVHPSVYGTHDSVWHRSKDDRNLQENCSVASPSTLKPHKSSSPLIGKQHNYSQQTSRTELTNGKHINGSLRKDGAMHSTSDSEKSISQELANFSHNSTRDTTPGSRGSGMIGCSHDGLQSSVGVNGQDAKVFEAGKCLNILQGETHGRLKNELEMPQQKSQELEILNNFTKDKKRIPVSPVLTSQGTLFDESHEHPQSPSQKAWHHQKIVTDHSGEKLLENRHSERTVDSLGQLLEGSLDLVLSSQLEQKTLNQTNPQTVSQYGGQGRLEDEAKIEQKFTGLDILHAFMESRVSRDGHRTSGNVTMKPEGALQTFTRSKKHPPDEVYCHLAVMNNSSGGLSDSRFSNHSVDISCQLEEESFDLIPSQSQLEQKDRNMFFVGKLSAHSGHILDDHITSDSGGFDVNNFRDVTPSAVKDIDTNDYKQSFLAEILPTTQGDPELTEGTRPWHSCRRSASVSPDNSFSTSVQEYVPGDCVQNKNTSFSTNTSLKLQFDLEHPHKEASPSSSMCESDTTAVPAASLVRHGIGTRGDQDHSQFVDEKTAEMPNLCQQPVEPAALEKATDNKFCLSSNILEALGQLSQWKELNSRMVNVTSDDHSQSHSPRPHPSESLRSLLGLSLSPQERLKKVVSKAANIIRV